MSRRMAGEVISGAVSSAPVIEDRETSWAEIAAKYSAGDHLIDAGPEVGVFWASNITSVDNLQPMPFAHAVQVLGEAQGLPAGGMQ